MVRRRIIFEYRIICYDERDVDEEDCPGSVTNWPTPNIEDAPWYEVPVIEERDFFDTTIEEWIELMTRNFDLLIQDQGEKDCQDITDYLHLCEYEIRVVGIEKVPQDVLDRIERLEGLIADSMKAIEEYEDQIADILAKKEEERTAEDREKLLRLDGYIRSEKENIRKFEFEIKRLKTEWKIE